MKLAKSEKNRLRGRWDVKQPLDANRSPFGLTSSGYHDFRGVPLNDFSKVLGRQFSKCDLSYSDFSGIYLEGVSFHGSRLAEVKFTDFTDAKNRFVDCIFSRCSFVGASMGIRTSHYEDCVFEGCNFRKSIFANAIFRDCQLKDNRLNDVDFNASGFWRCEFVGDFKDVTFRGDYLTDLERETNGKPQSTGLHEVDFRGARLSWVSVTSGCELNQVQMPGKHPAVICRLSKMLTRFDDEFGGDLTPGERVVARQFLGAFEPWAQGQDFHILCLGDMIEKCGEKVGSLLFEYATSYRARRDDPE